MDQLTDLAELAPLLAQSAALHDHVCPRQVLGVRIGLYGACLLDVSVPQIGKRLWTFVETDGCFADGIAVATGCWFGRRTLRLMDQGKIAATMVDAETGQALRIRPCAAARERALDYATNASSRWHAYLHAYARVPAADLFDVQPVRLTVSLSTIISRPDARMSCSRCGEEIINEREVWRAGAPCCRSCADEGAYYQSSGDD